MQNEIKKMILSINRHGNHYGKKLVFLFFLSIFGFILLLSSENAFFVRKTTNVDTQPIIKQNLSIQYPVNIEQSTLAHISLKKMAKGRTYWPTKEWQEKNLHQAGINKDKFQLFINYIFPTRSYGPNRKGIRTDGIVIIKDGYLVYENYNDHYHKDKIHLVWSVTKSITNALIGIAIQEKKITLTEKVSRFYPSLQKNPQSDQITIHNLLHMNSGLYWNEGYESSPLFSSVLAMLYTRGSKDMALFAINQKQITPPGQTWYYSSGTTNILSAILRKSIDQDSEYDEYPWTRLFNPLGMKNVSFERDASGTFVGSSYLYMRPRDLAKFGFLFLNNGQWENKQILPENWVYYTTTREATFTNRAQDTKNKKNNYAAQWYLNVGLPEKGISRPWIDAPKDTFHASGHWGQFLFVIPSLDLVVVRVGDDRENVFNKNTFLKLLIQSIDLKKKQKTNNEKGNVQ